MKLSSMASDPKKEVEGVWVPVGDEGAKLLIARSGNPQFAKVMTALMAPHRQALRNGVLPEGVASEVLAEATAKTILLGWEAIKDDNNKAIVYSWQEAKKVLKDPKYRDFRELVLRLSEDAELFRQSQVQEDLAAVKLTSAGT